MYCYRAKNFGSIYGKARPRTNISEGRMLRDVYPFRLDPKISVKIPEEIWSGRRGSNSHHQLGKLNFRSFNFQYLQNAAEKMFMHALHTVHALPDLRVAGGRLRDSVSLDLRSPEVLASKRKKD